MDWFTENATLKHGINNMGVSKIRNKMHQYTIYKGKLIGDFEGLYKDFKDPFLQSKKEKFETTKKVIINY